MNIFQSAEQSWPEDEASMTINSYLARKENGWDEAELKEGLEKDITHMVKVFSGEDDAEDLIRRYKTFIKGKGVVID